MGFVSSLCSVGVPLLVSLPVSCALVLFLACVAPVCRFGLLPSFLLPLLLSRVLLALSLSLSLSFLSLSLFLFWPRAALLWNGLGSLGNQVLTHPTHVNGAH